MRKHYMKVLQDRYTKQFLDIPASRSQDIPVYNTRPTALLTQTVTMNELRQIFRDFTFLISAIENCDLLSVDVVILN